MVDGTLQLQVVGVIMSLTAQLRFPPGNRAVWCPSLRLSPRGRGGKSATMGHAPSLNRYSTKPTCSLGQPSPSSHEMRQVRYGYLQRVTETRILLSDHRPRTDSLASVAARVSRTCRQRQRDGRKEEKNSDTFRWLSWSDKINLPLFFTRATRIVEYHLLQATCKG